MLYIHDNINWYFYCQSFFWHKWSISKFLRAKPSQLTMLNNWERLGSSAQEHWTVEMLPRVQFCTIFRHMTVSQRIQYSCALDPIHSLNNFILLWNFNCNFFFFLTLSSQKRKYCLSKKYARNYSVHWMNHVIRSPFQ